MPAQASNSSSVNPLAAPSSTVDDSIVCKVSSKRKITYMNTNYFKKVENLDRNESLKSIVSSKEVTCVIMLDPLLTVYTGLSSESTTRALK